MSIGAIGFNPFDYDPSKLQAAHKIGLNGGMATGANGGTKAHQHNPLKIKSNIFKKTSRFLEVFLFLISYPNVLNEASTSS